MQNVVNAIEMFGLLDRGDVGRFLDDADKPLYIEDTDTGSLIPAIVGLESVAISEDWGKNFGAAAAKYIDAFFQNIRWETVQARLERARKATNV